MPFLVPMSVVFSLLFAISARWNDHFHLRGHQGPDKIGVIIGPVGNQALELQLSHQRFCLGNVMALTTRQAKAQWVAQRIHAHMDFGAEPAPAPAEGLFGLAAPFLAAPAAQGCARITLLSRIRFSMSGSSTKC